MRYEFKWFSSIKSIPKTLWDGLTENLDHPLLDWDWLNALEISGSVGGRSGWMAQYLTCWNEVDLVAAAPFYLKNHSFGEFVYDFVFAQAVEDGGVDWYPKFLGMSPLTPSPAFQFLFNSDFESTELVKKFYDEIIFRAKNLGTQSVQFNFMTPNFLNKLMIIDPELRQWSHQGFLWEKGNLKTFEDYLNQFNKNQRRNIKREIQTLIEREIRIEMIDGAGIPESWFPLMRKLYHKTNDQFGPWAARFLTDEFFDHLGDLRQYLIFGAAFRSGDSDPFAMSLLIKKNRRLIGRYWGALEFVPDLYFNLCYYKPIEFALENDFDSFDPGAGSELKIRRGFKSIDVPSLHRIFNPRVDQFFNHYLQQLNQIETIRIQQMNQAIPFKD